LVSDRGAVLTVRAAARGVVDFSAARVLDVGWWRKTNLLISSMADDDRLLTLRAAFDFQRALVANGNLTKESFEGCQKTCREILDDIWNVVSPWSKATQASVRSGQIGSLIDAYKRMVGDPDDPKFRDKLLKELELQESARNVVQPESDDARVSRLAAARDAERERRRNRKNRLTPGR